MDRFLARTKNCAVIILGIFPCTQAGAQSFDGVFPHDFKAGFILRIADLPEDIHPKKLLFSLAADGRPFVYLNDKLIALQHRTDVVAKSLTLKGVDSIDDFAWMGNGALLVISGRKLGAPTGQGFRVLITLPAEDMKIAPATADYFYLYGGDTPAQRQNLYVYERSGSLLHLLWAPQPIGSVSGDGEFTFLAVGDSVYLLVPGRLLTLVFAAGDEVTSLAMAPPWGLFYATANKVGYVRESGKAYAFLTARDAEVRVDGEDLYVLIPGDGIVKGSPVSSFDQVLGPVEHLQK